MNVILYSDLGILEINYVFFLQSDKKLKGEEKKQKNIS